MRRLRIITGLCLVAGFVMSIGMTATATAGPPEWGRCLKKAVAGGAGFSNAGCTTAVASAAKYEWTSAINKNKFTATMNAGTLATLETVSATKVTCTGESNGGEYTGPKTVGNIVAKFTGCETSAIKCNSISPLGGAGEIITDTLEGELGFVTSTNVIGLALKGPGTGLLAEFECSSAFIFKVKGQVVHNVQRNSMLLTRTELFVETSGEQLREKFFPGVLDERILEVDVNGGAFEEAGLKMKQTLTNEEKVEASSVN